MNAPTTAPADLETLRAEIAATVREFALIASLGFDLKIYLRYRRVSNGYARMSRVALRAHFNAALMSRGLAARSGAQSARAIRLNQLAA